MTGSAFCRALSLSRPWTELVLRDGKNVENRRWRTGYRGPVVIHGAKSYDESAIEVTAALVGVDRARMLEVFGLAAPTGYLGLVDLVDIHPGPDTDGLPGIDCGCRWGFPGQWHWVLERPRLLPRPMTGAGKPGLFDPPRVVVDVARLCGLL